MRSPAPSARRRWTLLLMCVATFMIQLDVTAVNVALPRIQAGLDMTGSGLEWVIGAYALGLAALVPVGGALGDRYGRKRIFLAGTAIFTLGSAACALAPTPTSLIADRAVQGVGGAAMLALTLSIITEAFPAGSRAGAIGTWAAVGGTGFGVGPAAGGVLLTSFGWASIFWVNVPIGVAGIAGTAVAVRETRNPDSRRLDTLGVLLSAAGLVGVTLGLIEAASHTWGSAAVLAPLALGAALLVAFIFWQRRTPHAMVPPQLLGARSFTVAATVYSLSYMSLSATLFYVSLLYQDVIGWSALRTGLSWLLMNVPFLCMAQLAGTLERRCAPVAIVGSACTLGAVGIALLGIAGPTTPFLLTAFGYLISGAGFGVLVPSITHLAMRDVPAGASGAASAVLNASRQIGTSIGLAVLGAVGATVTAADWHSRTMLFAASVRDVARNQTQQVAAARIAAVVRALGQSHRQAAAQSFATGYHVAVGCGAGCVAIAGVVAILGLRRPLRPHHQRESPIPDSTVPGAVHGTRPRNDLHRNDRRALGADHR